MSFICCHVHGGIRCETIITKISGKYLRPKMIAELGHLKDSENQQRNVIDKIVVQGFQWLCQTHYDMVKKMDIQKMNDNKQLKLAYVGDSIHKIMWKVYADKLKKIGFIDACVTAQDCNGHPSFFADPKSGKWCYNGKFQMFDMNKFFRPHINLPALSSNVNNSNSNSNSNVSYKPVRGQTTAVNQQRFEPNNQPMVEIEDKTEYGNKERGKPNQNRRLYNHEEIITFCLFLQFESSYTGVRDAVKYFKEDQTNAVGIYMDENHGYVRKPEGYGKMYKIFIGDANPKHSLLNLKQLDDDEKDSEYNKQIQDLWTEIKRAKTAVKQRQLTTHGTGSSSESATTSARSGAKIKRGFVAPSGAPGGPDQAGTHAKTKITRNSIELDKLQTMRDSNKAKNAMVKSINKLGHNETDKKSLADVVTFVENNIFVHSGSDLQMDIWQSIEEEYADQFIMLWRTIHGETVEKKTKMIIKKYNFLKKMKERRQNK